ncbi:hypothetical protein [Actinocatenispora rupis]|uniref:hypothetical protein n=1 Tax=Actinocatenispora rupis TaxID=519421 RepID=UPI0019412B5C|nr:hypothetical protein [Actinocatenispora rupis]
MPRFRTRRTLAAALAAGALVAGAVAVGPAAAGSTPRLATAPPAATTVTLVTGDQVVATPGRPALLRSRVDGAHQYTTADGHLHVVPAVAQPYLGRLLDPALFDVTALAAGAPRTLTLTYAAGHAPVAPPGVTLTGTSGHTATGYVSAGRRFAGALRAGLAADVRAGRRPGTGGLPGLAGVRRTGGGTVAVQPKYPLRTLTVHVTDRDGAPATMYVFVCNVDDLRRVDAGVLAVDGEARINVPAGHYDVSTMFGHYDDGGRLTETRLVARNDVTVGDSGEVALDERDSTVPVTVTAPRPTTPALVNLLYARRDATGRSFVEAATSDGSPVYVNAQPAPTTGALHYVVQWSGLGTDPARPYRYDVAFPFPDVPADQHLTVDATRLAVVRHRFSADPAAGDPAPGMLYAGVADDVLGGVAALLIPSPAQSMPGTVTQYLGTADGGGWRQAALTPANQPMFGDVQHVTAGREYAVDWYHGPLVPGFVSQDGTADCGACAAGDTLSLGLDGWTDSTAGHAGSPGGKGLAAHLTVYRDGTSLGTVDGRSIVRVTGVPAEPATYRVVYDQDLGAVAGVGQSTVTRTDVSVPYRPGSGDLLPVDDTCGGQSADTPCRILPALTLGYRLGGDERNRLGGATARMRLDVGHLTYGGAGSRAPVTDVRVDVSTDGGAHWTAATVTGTAGRYAVSWPNPAPGTSPALRVRAADALGGSITQTVTAAYTVADR